MFRKQKENTTPKLFKNVEIKIGNQIYHGDLYLDESPDASSTFKSNQQTDVNSFWQQEKLHIKIAVIGCGGVGKTSFINCFMAITSSYKTTYLPMGYPIFHKGLVSLDITECPSYTPLSDFGERRGLYDQQVAIFLFDVNVYSTFENINQQVEHADMYLSEGYNKILVGTKIDLENQRVVSKKRIDELINNKRFDKYIEISNKNDLEVENVFISAVKLLQQRNKLTEQENSKSLLISKYQQAISDRDNDPREYYKTKVSRLFDACSKTEKINAYNKAIDILNNKDEISSLNPHIKALNQGNSRVLLTELLKYIDKYVDHEKSQQLTLTKKR